MLRIKPVDVSPRSCLWTIKHSYSDKDDKLARYWRGESTRCSSMTSPLSRGKTIELYNGPGRGFLEDEINYKRTDKIGEKARYSFDC